MERQASHGIPAGSAVLLKRNFRTLRRFYGAKLLSESANSIF